MKHQNLNQSYRSRAKFWTQGVTPEGYKYSHLNPIRNKVWCIYSNLNISVIGNVSWTIQIQMEIHFVSDISMQHCKHHMANFVLQNWDDKEC